MIMRHLPRLWLALLATTLMAIVGINLTSTNVQAAPNDLMDLSEIVCNDRFKGKSDQVDACKQGYIHKDSSGWCDRKNDYNDDQKNACKGGASERRNPAEVFCGSKFNRPATGQMYTASNPFSACYAGFDRGEAYCNQQFSKNQGLLDACKKGYEGQVSYSDMMAESSKSTDGASSSSGSPQVSKLGPDPRHSNINKILVPKDVSETKGTCALEGVFGTMMCDGLAIVARMADSSLAVLGSFMKVDPLTTDDENPIYRYWQAFQSIANVLFIIALLAVILSHVSNIGLSAYDVRKMLPRLVVGAVLLNLSYALCAVAVDISNIVGGTVYDTMSDLVAPKQVDGPNQEEDRLQTNVKTTQITDPDSGERQSFSSVANAMAFARSTPVTGGMLDKTERFAGKAMNAALSALLPIIVTVLLAIVVTVVCLLLRQALIIAFIIISPLAFAAFLLPNTKTLFDRWLKSFIPLIMLFPVIAFTFGMGAIAAQIIAAGAFANPNYVARTLFVLMALSVQIVPLIAVPKLMSFGGGLLAQLSNMANGQTAGINNKAKQYAEKQKEIGDSLAKDNPRWYNWHRRRRFDAKQKDEALESALEAAQERYSKDGKAVYGDTSTTPPESPTTSPTDTSSSPDSPTPTDTPPAEDKGSPADADSTDEDTSAADSSDEPDTHTGVEIDTGGSTDEGDDAQTRNIYAIARGKVATVKARCDLLKSSGIPDDVIVSMALGREEGATAIDQEAAIMRVVADKNVGAILEISKASAEMPRPARQTFVSSLNSNASLKDSAPMLANPEAQDNIMKGNVTPNTFASSVVAPSLRTDDYSPESITALDNQAGLEVANALANADSLGISNQIVQDVRHAAARSLDSEKTRRNIGRQLGTVEQIAGRTRGGES